MSIKSEQQRVAAQTHIVNVAVAVIHYQEQYLLGFRSAQQHQGNRYEFVGGKIDADETVKQALIREVNEETGIDIHDNTIVKLGRLHHDYNDKQVCLQVYKIELTTRQYDQHKYCQYGLEGQALTWADKDELLVGKYPLPAANQTILTWLRLPPLITVTYALSDFDQHTDPAAAWLAYHRQHLAAQAWVYVRIKAPDSKAMTKQLMQLRPDLQMIVPDDFTFDGSMFAESLLDQTASKAALTEPQVVATHLTHGDLMHWYAGAKDTSQKRPPLSSDQPIIVSCHDLDSIYAANQLAAERIQQGLPVVIGMFLSPVLATQTHPDTVPLGWIQWSALAAHADIPVIGLGGLAPDLLQDAKAQGAAAIAGIRQFLQSH